MVLEFRPLPIPEERQTPNEGLQFVDKAAQMMQLFTAYKQQKQANELSKQQRAADLAAKLNEGGTDFMDSYQAILSGKSPLNGPAAAFAAKPTPAATPAPAPTPMPAGPMMSMANPQPDPYQSIQDPYGPLPGMGVAPEPMQSMGAPGAAQTPAAAQAPGALQAPAGPKTATEITPEFMAQLRKKKGTKGVEEFQKTQGFLTGERQANAQIGQIGVQNENALRDDFTKQSQSFSRAADQMGVIRSIYSGEPDKASLGRFTQAKTPDAARDMALVYSYMKILDDGSTVRETEYANATNARGIPDIVKGYWNKLQTGELLDPNTRSKFVAAAGDLYAGRLEKQKQLEKQYTGIAERQGINPQNAVMDYGIPNYDPSQFRLTGGRTQGGGTQSTGGQKAPPAFGSVQDAEAAGLPKGTIVMIGKRRAVIE